MGVYHLHIPRTSGVYIRNFVMPHLLSKKIDHFASNRSDIDVEHIAKCEYVSGHFGLMPLKHMDNPVVFSLVRDPVERFISYFKYTTGINRTYEENMEKLDNWLYGEQSEIQSNLQSKFLTGSMNVDEFNSRFREKHKAVTSGWFIEDYSLNMADIKQNIDNFYVYPMTRHDEFKEDFNKCLDETFGFKIFKHNDKANSSHEIKVDFTPDRVSRIEELNSVDIEMYDYVRSIKKRY